MKLSVVNHPWIDDEFYQTGSFISCDQGKSLLLLKAGRVSSAAKDPADQTPSIFCKDFYRDRFFYHVSDQYLKIDSAELRRMISTEDLPLELESDGDENKIFGKDFVNLTQQMGESLKKVVLLSRENFISSDSKKIRQHLVAQAILKSEGRAYGFWHRNRGILGSTPETLFEVRDGELLTEALAGTAKIGQESKLLKSHKDQQEHEFVVRDIGESLGKLGLKALVHETEVSHFSKIVHLRTKITARMAGNLSAEELSRALSPTAALGGYPRLSSRNFLLSSHYKTKYPIRFFGSVIGTDSGGAVGLVMIRNVQWDKEVMWIESGVGIVPESKLEKETEEILLKRQSVREHYL